MTLQRIGAAAPVARPARRLTGHLAASTATASGGILYEIVPIFGAYRVRGRIKTATNGGTIDAFLAGPDFDPEQKSVAASVTINPSGAENAITYTAKDAYQGFVGESISVTYVDPAGANKALSVTVSKYAITVNLATDGASAITTTAAQLKAAIEAHAEAKLLVSLAFASDGGLGDGSGVVTAMSATNLAIAYSALAGTIYTTGNPTQVAVSAGTEAKIDVDCYGEDWLVLKFTGTVGAGTITYVDVCQLFQSI